MDEATCLAAAKNGHVEALVWLRENGCNWRAIDCSEAAASEGHLDVLKMILRNENRNPTWIGWKTSTCANAARGGHLEVLKWLRENGWP